MKILYLNTQYFQFNDGRLFSRLFEGIFLIMPRPLRLFPIRLFARIVKDIDPDIVCLVEVKKWQFDSILDSCKSYGYSDFENKYHPEGLACKMPSLKNRGNAFMSKIPIDFEKKLLENGSKKLIYQLNLADGLKFVFIHYALGGRTRKKQFRELAKMYAGCKKLLFTGDFNVFGGGKELIDLKLKLNLDECDIGPTFPSFNPTKKLDRVLYTKNQNIFARALRDTISDHSPVVIEIKK